ncbi:prephenate dehydratase [Candidatus Pacebacteria bacterium]|nr:prephenate dehydratase [Candidatus Paceibacterota bacterium]
MKIGVMGAHGSFSEEAGEEYIRQENVTEATIEPLLNAETVLTAVENNEVYRGIFPIENSNGGIVIEAVHAMAKHRFAIERMFDIDVHHMLLVKPGMTAAHITQITSHDQALKQCRMYLKRAWPEVDIATYEDTAAAAKALNEGELPDTTAVIAPKRSADLYGLEVLEASIQDLKFNFTTFVVAKKLEE